MGGKQVGYSSLLFLLEHSEKLNVEVVGIFENTTSALSTSKYALLTLAQEFGIPHFNDKTKLEGYSDVDFIFSVQYNEILTENEIQVAKEMAVNLHMAPLPEYRGCNQFSFALLDEAKEFGTTLHVLEPQTDAGAILFEKRFKILPEEFVTSLYEKTLKASIELFREKVEDILNGNYMLTPQPELFEERGTSFHLRSEINQIKRIESSWDIEKQKRHFRATYFPAFSPPVLIDGIKEKPLGMDWYNQLK